MSGIIDTHAHLTSDALYPDVDILLQRAQQAGINTIVNICTDPVTLERGLSLAEKYPWVKNTAATTPHDVLTEGETAFPVIDKAARAGLLCAVGESGLDYYYEHSPKKEQQIFFQRYLALAKECRLPLVIHCRDAFEDLFSIIDDGYNDVPAILHCFTGSLDEAKKAIERGFFISFSGIVTFKKSDALRDVAHYVPADRLLLETDSPYLAPHTKRGIQNEPAFIVETYACVASIRGVKEQALIDQVRTNAHRIFKL